MPTAGTAFSTISLPSSGVWLFYWNIQMNYSTLPTLIYTTVSNTVANGGAYGIQGSGNNGLIFNNMIIVASNQTSYSLNIDYQGGSGFSVSASGSYFRAIRIA